MGQALEKRLRRLAKRHRLYLFLLVLSLALAGFALHGWYTSSYRPEPGDLHRYSGTVKSVSHVRNRYGRITGIRFHLESAGPELGYFDFYPSFDLAQSCLVQGAPVTVGVTEPESDVWQLSCGGRVVSDIDSMARAQLENGRYALYLAIGSGMGSAFWIWLILSNSKVPARVPRKARKKQAA